MLFRRVSTHVRQQNWFAVAIDFVIVVLGVFIGIQVANWNEGRAEKIREAQFLEELALDISADAGEIEEIRQFTLLRLAALSAILERCSGDVLADVSYVATIPIIVPDFSPLTDEQALRPLTFANVARTTSPHRGAYEALVGAGEIRLISSSAIRRAIQAYYAQLDELGRTEHMISGYRDRAVEILGDHGVGIFDTIGLKDLGELICERDDAIAILRSNREFVVLHTMLLDIQERMASELLAEIDS